jgi:diadenylate cyclase
VLAVSNRRDERRRAALAVVAPGTAIRDGLERIVRGHTGALIVLGYDDVVRDICSGGFELGAEFSATRLRELAKMDGAIVLDRTGTTILRAAVQLVPDPELPTQESGTRHRTAERVARQTGFPVITVSKSMSVIAVYDDRGERHVLEDSATLLARAHQALATLDRYKRRLDQATGVLSGLEIEDRVTLRDVTAVAQRLEMASRMASEIGGYLIELGTDSGLLTLQLNELTAGSGLDREFLVRDYAPPGPVGASAQLSDGLAFLTADELLDMRAVAAALRPGLADDLDQAISPRGYRLLSRIPRLDAAIAGRLVGHFGGLQKLLSASAADLRQVDGIDAGLAIRVREGLSRLAEATLVDRYP